MKLLAMPRDANPYQGLLYGAMGRRGVRVRYIGGLTRSRTLNVALLPLELAARRLAGWRVVHVHWVFGFALPGAGRLSPLRRLGQAWFALWLATARALDVRVVWTAHNVLPHGRVFHDDLAARRALVRASRLVIAHSRATLDEMASLGIAPAAAAVIPQGRMELGRPGVARREPGAGGPPRRLLFLGQVHEYKGVEDLLAAIALLPPGAPVRLTVAGRCPDPALGARLRALAAGDGRVTLRLEHVPDEEAARLLEAADAVVLPFRRITNSSSAVLALAHGRPLVVPRLPALEELPDGAVERYDGTVPGLAGAIGAIAGAAPERLAAMSAAARAHPLPGWDEVADRTLAAIRASGVPA
jgi:glycosyltransferase involved in cell wall biosynthesis